MSNPEASIVYPTGYESLRSSLVVVARSWENLDWLHECKRPFLIYNKGKDDIPFPSVKLPNVGRDCGTYLNFIVDFYYKLPDFVFFIQGDPFEKYPRIIPKLREDNWHPTINILCEHLFVEDVHGNPSGPMEDMIPLLKHLGIYEDHMMHTFGMGAQYIVPKEFITNKSFRWWKSANDYYVNGGDEEHQRAMAYKFEKIFLKIFTYTECYANNNLIQG